MKRLIAAFFAIGAAQFAFAAGELEDAVLHGETDKPRAIDYKPGEEMTFTLSLQRVKELPPDTYFISWERTGDDGITERGKVPASLTQPLVVKTKLDKPGFVRVHAFVVDGKGNAYRKSFHGDPSTPEGKRALNAFERRDKRVFFDGGAGVEPEKLQSVPEPETDVSTLDVPPSSIAPLRSDHPSAAVPSANGRHGSPEPAGDQERGFPSDASAVSAETTRTESVRGPSPGTTTAGSSKSTVTPSASPEKSHWNKALDGVKKSRLSCPANAQNSLSSPAIIPSLHPQSASPSNRIVCRTSQNHSNPTPSHSQQIVPFVVGGHSHGSPNPPMNRYTSPFSSSPSGTSTEQ